MIRRLVLGAALLALSACSFEPAYRRPAPAVPPYLPAVGPEQAPPAALSYRDMFHDPKLVALIDQALANNQDLKAALANVRIARGQVAVARAALFPTVSGVAGYNTGDNSNETRQNNGSNGTTGGGGGGTGNGASTGGRYQTYTAELSASWEIDLFGRLRSLSNAAFDQYLATEAAQRGARLTLIAGVANAYLTLAADRSLLAIAQQTTVSAGKSVDLTRSLLTGGVRPRTDLRQAETILDQAQADQASLETAVAVDRDALQLLVGAPVTDDLLPPSIESIDGQLAEVPAGLDSSILLRRPDVVQAEYGLRAANAQIGAARAAFFPRISLTALAGFASAGLSNLFQHDAFTWNVAPTATQPIFNLTAIGNLRVVRAQRELALATYQKAIQSAFRDIADALARRATIDTQLDATTRLDAAARDSLFLSNARYHEGIDPYLSMLDAQRTAYGAARTLVSARLLKAQNLVTLYQSLGGDQLIDTLPPGKGGNRAKARDAQ